MSRHGHRFFVPRPLSPGNAVDLDPQQSKQIVAVLRLRAGDLIGLFNGDHHEYSAAIQDASKSTVHVRITAVERGPNPLSPPIWLALALIKSDRFEWALQKATELGIARVIPMESEQSVISLRVDRAERRFERWRRIAIEAAEQSGRCDIPEICEPVSLAQALASSRESLPILLWEDEATTPLTSIDVGERPVLLVVGPEGGFSQSEIEAARSLGVATASLGPFTLRAETAAVAAVAMLVGRQLARDSIEHLSEHQGGAE